MITFQPAIDSVGRAVASFYPRTQPYMLRANYARELAAWSVLPLMLGVVEGGVVGVLAKTYFAGTVTPSTLNMTVALLAGAPAFANIVSFLWAAVSHGRHKIRMLTRAVTSQESSYTQSATHTPTSTILKGLKCNSREKRGLYLSYS